MNADACLEGGPTQTQSSVTFVGYRTDTPYFSFQRVTGSFGSGVQAAVLAGWASGFMPRSRPVDRDSSCGYGCLNESAAPVMSYGGTASGMILHAGYLKMTLIHSRTSCRWLCTFFFSCMHGSAGFKLASTTRTMALQSYVTRDLTTDCCAPLSSFFLLGDVSAFNPFYAQRLFIEAPCVWQTCVHKILAVYIHHQAGKTNSRVHNNQW